MSKIMVFMGPNYYPNGGWEDFKGYFDSIEMAKEFIKNIDLDENWVHWAHIVYEDKIIIEAKRSEFPEQDWEFEGVQCHSK